MGLYAFEEIEEALSETKELLLPFDAGTWLRLAIIVVFTGQGLNIPGTPSSMDSGSTGYYDTGGTESPIQSSLQPAKVPDIPVTGLSIGSTTAPGDPVLVLLGAVFLALIVFFAVISSIFEFVFYQSLLDKEVRIRKNFRKHFGNGLRYLFFRTGVMALMVIGLVIALLPVNSSPVLSGGLLLAWVLLLLPVMIFLGLTNNFVLLKMMEKDIGILAAWRDFYPELKEEWRQVAVYVFVRFVLGIAAGFFTLIWLLVTLLTLAIPFGILAFILSIAANWLAALILGAGVIVWLGLLIGVRVPIQTYLYHYAILVYHDLTG